MARYLPAMELAWSGTEGGRWGWVGLGVSGGEKVGVVGEAGWGNAILAPGLMGLRPPAPYSQRSGRILLSGRDIAALDEAQLSTVRGREIAMIFQDPMT